MTTTYGCGPIWFAAVIRPTGRVGSGPPARGHFGPWICKQRGVLERLQKAGTQRWVFLFGQIKLHETPGFLALSGPHVTLPKHAHRLSTRVVGSKEATEASDDVPLYCLYLWNFPVLP